MTPDARLDEVAAILAQAILRLNARAIPAAPPSDKNPVNQGESRLDCVADTLPHPNR